MLTDTALAAVAPSLATCDDAIIGSTSTRWYMADVVMIRPLYATDRGQWETLWRGYLDFYRADLSAEVTERTWAALCEETSAVHGLVAEVDGELAGLAHTVLHPTTWASGPACYLEDLFVARPWRGRNVARRLIEAVYEFADEVGAASVYWITQEYNAAARSLYDTVAHRTSYVHYQR